MKHLTDIKQLTKSNIEQIHEQAKAFESTAITKSKQLHQGKSAMALFFENSTRTLASFQLACQRLGVDIMALNIAHSSTQKGETIKDTLLTLNAMQTDAFIIRHPENNIHQKVVDWVESNASIINAGDGTNQHPTQGLLDLYTIWNHKKSFANLKVAIVGDIAHSRVANSLIDGLKIMGTTEIILCGPEGFVPTHHNNKKADSINDALSDADVIIMLRIQNERLPKELDLNFDQWHDHYGLNSQRLKLAKPDAIVMHPGPMNRGIEISNEVADGTQSVILEQVKNGVLVRQALIHQLLC